MFSFNILHTKNIRTKILEMGELSDIYIFMKDLSDSPKRDRVSIRAKLSDI